MINTTEAYKDAVIADSRKTVIRAAVKIADPDLQYDGVTSSSLSQYAKPAQLTDEIESITRVNTLEHNRWVLDGGGEFFASTSNNYDMAILGDVISGADGSFSPAWWVEQAISGVDILQSLALSFSNSALDGVPRDFDVLIKQNGTAYHTATITDNAESSLVIDGFRVFAPDAIRIVVRKWSLPHRKARISDLFTGIKETWSGRNIAEFSCKQQVDVSNLSMPYGTVSLTIDNIDRRFEPRNKNSIFQSIEERQAIDISIGVDVGGSTEFVPIGKYYQSADGWKTSDNNTTIRWGLVDIIGLLANRKFICPDTVPTTMQGWASAIVGQLGTNFSNAYVIDDAAKATSSVTATKDNVNEMDCGDMIRYLAMATGTFARADAETGLLRFMSLPTEGDKITLDNLQKYPTMAANADIAAIIFKLSNTSELVVSGNNTAADVTKSVNNPFIKTAEKAVAAARLILETAGGNKIDIIGRGNPASECGDVDRVWLSESVATSARRTTQNFDLNNGVLQNCTSTLIQPDGAFHFSDVEVITESGTWTAPAGVSRIRFVLVGGGQGGEHGEDGTDADPETGSPGTAGRNGADGTGGNVYTNTININNQQQFAITIGEGGRNGGLGGDTAFGSYSSANGQNFKGGYADIADGTVYARAAVKNPLAGSGDGGKGGKGGSPGRAHTSDSVGGGQVIVVDSQGGGGSLGARGGSGCVVVWYDKE